jgi:hypothetical protein
MAPIQMLDRAKSPNRRTSYSAYDRGRIPEGHDSGHPQKTHPVAF